MPPLYPLTHLLVTYPHDRTYPLISIIAAESPHKTVKLRSTPHTPAASGARTTADEGRRQTRTRPPQPRGRGRQHQQPSTLTAPLGPVPTVSTEPLRCSTAHPPPLLQIQHHGRKLAHRSRLSARVLFLSKGSVDALDSSVSALGTSPLLRAWW